MLVAVAGAVSAQAQTVSTAGTAPDGFAGGPAPIAVVDELSPASRAAIQAQLDASRQRLAQQGLLPPLPRGAVPPVTFAWPLAAMPGLTDYGYHGISNFIDEDPAFGGAVLDYDCGARTYDGHRGTDFFLWPFAFNKVDADAVAVVAAAPGTIILKLDGNFDRSCTLGGGTWNAVYVQHADGSIAWYGHMKSGSLTSKPAGAAVAQGEFLGIVGSSGNSTGPHLHLEVYDSAANLIDYWGGPCNALGATSWWAAQRPYYDSAINHLMTGGAAPVLNPCPNPDTPNAADVFAPGATIYFSSYYRDQLAGQVAQHTIYRPDNSVYASWTHSIDAPHYAASYWYWFYTDFAPAGPLGTWRYEIVYEGETYAHDFVLTDTPPGPCAAVPLGGCDTAEKSKLLLKEAGESKDKLQWTFVKGALPIARDGFGDPTASDATTFCVYDASGPAAAAALKLEAEVAAGSGWAASGTAGYKFVDKAGTQDGIALVLLKAGASGDPKPPKIKVKGRGAALDDPLPPALVPPVRAQLVGGNGACWEATYAAPATNDGASFKATSP